MSSTSSSIDPAPSQIALPHFRVSDDLCPYCDQAIPHDRADEIRARIRMRQRDHEATATARIREQHVRETAEAVEAAKRAGSLELEREKQESAAREAAARAAGQRMGEAAACERVAEAERKAEADRSALNAKLSEAESAREEAQTSYKDLTEQLETERHAGKAAIEKMQADATEKEALIREEATRSAEARMSERVAGIEATHNDAENALLKRATEAETAIASALESRAALQTLLDQQKLDSAAALDEAKTDAVARESAAREDERRVTEAAFHNRISEVERAKIDAESKAAAADEAARVLKETHESQIVASVNEVRLAMEADKLQAVNAAKAAACEDNRKMSEQLADMQRKLDQKTADQLGEGAEVDLFEDLKAQLENEGDKIERVGKGKPGADVIHTVLHNGMVCGKIIYDSKNHGQWRYDFAEKLAADKIAEKADHAILSTRKFPEGMKQLDVLDGVILANPARVVALVQVVREHIVKSHTLRMSNEEKALKSAELYAFITSSQYTDLLDRIDTQAQDLLDMRVKEQKAHEKMWKDQDILYRSIQKTGVELSNRVDIILGTVGKADKAVNE